MLQLQNLKASVNDKSILNGLNLEIKPGEVHAIMGPNGSGKSTLANILSGKSGYEVNGSLKYEGNDLQDIPIEERAQKGIFLAFQYPLEIPGVNTTNFLKTSLNTIRKANGDKELDTLSLLKLIKEKAAELNIDEKFLSRQLNVGFSGGEKKKNEILQLKLLNPKLAILGETDSGLDIDALRIVADGVNSHKNEENAFLIITHYQRLLDYIKPDFVHVLSKGRIIKTGSADLGQKLEKGNFSAKIRNRCYQLRFMRALANAYNDKMTVKGKGEAQLCMLLVRLYYLAAKMKMKDDDLNGPFYKVA